MNASKIIKVIAGLLSVIGWILVVCAANSISEYATFEGFLPQLVIGFIMTIPSWFMFNNYDFEEGEN